MQASAPGGATGVGVEIDDKMGKLVEQLGLEGEITLQNETLKGAMSAVPYMGAALTSLWAGRARARLVERLVALFDVAKSRLDCVEDSIIDKSFFDSEEFQTLLALAIEQLQTAHDQRKIRMLGTALANSGRIEHVKDHRKELFVRALRNLAPDQVAVLAQLRARLPTGGYYSCDICGPLPEVLMTMQALTSLGLVEEFPEKREPERFSNSGGTDPMELATQFTELRRAVSSASAPARRCFRISSVGLDFIRFVGEADAEDRG